MNCFKIWTHIYMCVISMRLAIFFNSKIKIYITKWATNWQKRGYIISIKKIPHYTIFLLFISYYIPVPTFLSLKLCKKKNPVINAVIPGFCSYHVVVFLNQEKWIWCIACNKWNVFQIPIMSPQVKETMLGQRSKHTLAQTVL